MLSKMLLKTLKKSQPNFYCEKCDYSANRKSDLHKHFTSKKHNATNNLIIKKIENIVCDCSKVYKHRSSFYRHKKICKFIANSNKMANNSIEDNEIKKIESSGIINMLKQSINDNKKLQERLILMQNEHNNTLQEIIPKIGNTTNNTHNRIINVQMFLHEKCNDAMSIQNFAKQIMITMDDLNHNKSDCITNVVLKNLEPLSITERPFHCTNLKKKEWFVKDEIQGWEEDNGEKVFKNTEVGIQKKWIDEFQRQYPNWDIDDNLKDKFVLIASSTSSELPEKLKIRLIKELGKEVTLTKNEIINTD